jgi:6-phosphofructokinase 1
MKTLLENSKSMNPLRIIAVMTSGGDAPGMNAALRAIVRTAAYHNIETIGIYNGYEGLIDKDFVAMETTFVSNIIQRGGTILRSARSKRFREEKWQKKAFQNLKDEDIDALIVIGGDGSFRGLNEFCSRFPVNGIGIPGTIDNDMVGTDFTIGYDTAINTVVEAVDKIRDTAYSHNRLFFVEVMGRDAGLIALRSGIAVGAEEVLIPETVTTVDDLVYDLITNRRMNKTSGIIIVAEGDELGGAVEVAKKVQERLPDYEFRVTILGHIQRGGAPSCMDRVRASIMGHHAVLALMEGHSREMVGIINNNVCFTSLEKAVKHHHEVPGHMVEMIKILAI